MHAVFTVIVHIYVGYLLPGPFPLSFSVGFSFWLNSSVKTETPRKYIPYCYFLMTTKIKFIWLVLLFFFISKVWWPLYRNKARFLIVGSFSNIGMVFCPASIGGQLRPILLLFCVLHACNKGVCLLSVNIKQDIGPPYTETKQKHRNLPTKMSKN